MFETMKALDRVLRGEATTIAALKANELDVPVWGLCVVIDVLGLAYGLCMGVYSLTTGGENAWKQTLSCMLKVPALFLLTLLVTFPSLYVFNAMVGSRLTFRSMIRLMVATLAVILAVLASIGPIVAFFSFTTTNYSFMILLNVLVFTIAGCLGMRFLLQSLHRMTVVLTFIPEITTETGPAPQPPIGPLEHMPGHLAIRTVRSIFQIWVMVFGLVGAQMAWVISPFLGHAGKQFVLFRPTGSNFFQGVLQNWNHLWR